MQALVCAEVMDAVEDISTQIDQTIGLPVDGKKKAREELATADLVLSRRPLPRVIEASSRAPTGPGSGRGRLIPPRMETK